MDGCLIISSHKYVIHIQDENKFYNISNLYVNGEECDNWGSNFDNFGQPNNLKVLRSKNNKGPNQDSQIWLWLLVLMSDGD